MFRFNKRLFNELFDLVYAWGTDTYYEWTTAYTALV